MSTIYNEGPYANWTAIHFPAGKLFCTSTTSGAFFNSVVVSQANQATPPFGSGFDATKLQGIITGNVSGATMDMRNAVIGQNFPILAASWPDCNPALGGDWRNYPDGAATVEAPSRNMGIFDSQGTTVNQALLWSYVKNDADPPPSTACSPDVGNILTLPAFILFEECTVTP